jgi:putative DNA primase/helicase
VDPNTKLAARPPAPGSEDKSNKVLIETRGEGGYAIVAPSCGPIHPSRKPYRLLSGGLETIAVLTPEEKDDLWDLARSLDEIPPKLVEDRRGGARPSQGTRPGDDFAATVSWPEILEPHGWKLSGRNGEKSSWTRPGKARGMSASTNHAGFDLLYVFSTSTAFEAGRGYSKFTAYTVLNHDGDFEAAAAELGRQGFGTASALTRTASDLGNAERLVDQHGDSIKHVREWKKWLFWDGTRWQRDQTGEVERRAKQTVRTIYAEAAGIDDKDGRQAIARFALKSEAYLATQHLLQQAMTEARVARTPVDFDQDPWLLNCLNGTVDLRTGQLAAHDPEHLITKLAPVAYDPTATDARWDSFIAEATGGDGELAAFLQACAGYSLTGDISEQKMFFIHGPGATGKSTFLEAIKGVLGDYAATADFETFVARPTSGGPRNDVARLQGKRMILSIEVDEGKKLAESLVKSLTGGDTVAARFLYTETVEFTPEGKLWLAANNLPVVRASDEAIWRRILLVPFVHVVPEARRDPRLKQSFVSDPALRSAILGWAIRGCLHWQRSGLRPPEAVAEATQDYRQEMNPLTQFIEDCCELRVGATVTAATLYRTYLDWVANEYSLSTVPKGKMLDSLRAFGVEAGKATGGERIYVGIQIAMD